uniref:Uncharacterized protein n=1 Tax=Helianthus annuus TaxID=4232 RepID=A0A251TWX7_HELAN
MLGLETANATAWEDFKDMIKEEYCHRDDIHKLEDEWLGQRLRPTPSCPTTMLLFVQTCLDLCIEESNCTSRVWLQKSEAM